MINPKILYYCSIQFPFKFRTHTNISISKPFFKDLVSFPPEHNQPRSPLKYQKWGKVYVACRLIIIARQFKQKPRKLVNLQVSPGG